MYAKRATNKDISHGIKIAECKNMYLEMIMIAKNVHIQYKKFKINEIAKRFSQCQ